MRSKSSQKFHINRENALKINELAVGSKTYHGRYVQDGFYDSIKTLKTIQSD